MRVWIRRIAITAALAAGLWLVPLVRLVPIRAEPTPPPDDWDTSAFAEALWTERLPKAIKTAADADTVLARLADDPAATAQEHGRRVGVSRGYFLFVRGEGVLGPAEGKGRSLRTPGGRQLVLETGPIFGSAVRDATGLVRSSDAPSSREYNELADTLSRMAEARAAVKLKAMPNGARVRFAACAKVTSPARFEPPLAAVPILVEEL
ncbi:DUF2291 family protein [Botrimarina sp.]|uniref:DUF2291 family protein n=1 Tax=Botrimarina sp. TaxID=2795802 RepID=UPI0032EFD850